MLYKRYDAEFTIKNTIGQPVVNAVLEAGGVTATTDVNGFARLAGLLPGNYDVKIGGPEYYESIYAISVADSTVSQEAVIVKKDLGEVVWEPDNGGAQEQMGDVRPVYASAKPDTGGTSRPSAGEADGEGIDETRETESPKPSETPSTSPSPSSSPVPSEEPINDGKDEDNASVNLGINISGLDGGAAADLLLEMHSDVINRLH
jgi:hypothetical protein